MASVMIYWLSRCLDDVHCSCDPKGCIPKIIIMILTVLALRREAWGTRLTRLV